MNMVSPVRSLKELNVLSIGGRYIVSAVPRSRSVVRSISNEDSITTGLPLVRGAFGSTWMSIVLTCGFSACTGTQENARTDMSTRLGRNNFFNIIQPPCSYSTQSADEMQCMLWYKNRLYRVGTDGKGRLGQLKRKRVHSSIAV